MKKMKLTKEFIVSPETADAIMDALRAEFGESVLGLAGDSIDSDNAKRLKFSLKEEEGVFSVKLKVKYTPKPEIFDREDEAVAAETAAEDSAIQDEAQQYIARRISISESKEEMVSCPGVLPVPQGECGVEPRKKAEAEHTPQRKLRNSENAELNEIFAPAD